MAKNKGKSKRKLKVKKTSFFWLYFVMGFICMIVSIFFAPFWKEISAEILWANWYSYALGIMLAVAIIFYIFLVLVKQIKKKDQHKVVRIIFGIELSIMVFLAVCSVVKAVLNDNEKFAFLNACEIVGVIIWLRGVVEMINAYYFDSKTGQKYPIWYLLFNILLVSVGPLVLLVGIKYSATVDLFVSYIFCSLLLMFGAFLCVLGGLSKPIKIVEEPVVELVEEGNTLAIENKEEIKPIEENKEELAQTEENNEEVQVIETKQEKLEKEIVIEKEQ